MQLSVRKRTTTLAKGWWGRHWGQVVEGLVLALLLAFSVGAVLLVSRVRQLRVEVETRVAWLTSLQEGVRLLDEEGGPSRAVPRLDRIAREIESSDGHDLALAEAATALRIAAEAPVAHERVEHKAELRRAVDTVVKGVRGETALISRQLGDLWGYLYLLVGASLGLAATTFILLRLWQRARLRAAEQARDAAEAKLLHADRLVAIGTLSATVAHEINNPIATVLLNLQLLEEWIASVDCDARGRAEGQDLASDALLGVERVASIVKDMRGFAQIEEGAEDAIDVRAPLEVALRLLKPALGGVVIEDLAEAPRVRAVSRRLEQVFVNLLINAVHAMESSQRSRELAISLDTTAEGQARIRIEDNGCGIPDEVAERAGQAFVTTKPLGRGTGLGLFVCRSIVTSLGGSLSLAKRAEGGTIATVLLPAAERRDPPRNDSAPAVSAQRKATSASLDLTGMPRTVAG